MMFQVETSSGLYYKNIFNEVCTIVSFTIVT